MTVIGRANRLRELIGGGRTAVGLSCALDSPQIAEEFARSGVDFVYLDQQHGLISQDAMIQMLRAIETTEATALVRVAGNDHALIGQALDAGAHGVIVPMVENAEQAAAAVDACRYFPAGHRSWGPIRAINGLGSDPEWVNSQVLCLVMIESTTALANLTEILDVAGVDGVYIGPADLGISLGQPPLSHGQSSNRDHHAAMARILTACRDRGLVAGISGDPVGLAAEGYQLVTAGLDIAMLRSALAGTRLEGAPTAPIPSAPSRIEPNPTERTRT